jgi:hypothetical protein
MHRLFLDLAAGGAPVKKSAAQYKKLQASIRPRDEAGKMRRRMAAEELDDAARPDTKLKAMKAERKAAVLATRSRLTDIYGLGPAALRRIIFVGPAKASKAKIRDADGDLDDLEEWVPTRTVMCPWGERQAFLRDESRWIALQEAAARDHDPVVEEAISSVFEATGDETGFIRVWTVDPKRAQRLWRRAGLRAARSRMRRGYSARRRTD